MSDNSSNRGPSFFNTHPNLPEFGSRAITRPSNQPDCRRLNYPTTNPQKQRNRTPCLFCKDARTQCILLPNNDSGICSRCDAKKISPEMCTLRVPLEHIVQVFLEKTERDNLPHPERGRDTQQSYLSECSNIVPPARELHDDVCMSCPPISRPVHEQAFASQIFLDSFDYNNHPELLYFHSSINVDAMSNMNIGGGVNTWTGPLYQDGCSQYIPESDFLSNRR